MMCVLGAARVGWARHDEVSWKIGLEYIAIFRGKWEV